MPLNSDVKEAVEQTNQAISQNSADFYLNMALSDAVSHQRRMNVILEASTAAILKRVENQETPIADGIAAVRDLTNNLDLSTQIKNLATAFLDVQAKLKENS